MKKIKKKSAKRETWKKFYRDMWHRSKGPKKPARSSIVDKIFSGLAIGTPTKKPAENS